MSYILDALKKAAEQRNAGGTVLLRPGAPLARAARFGRLPWIVAGILLLLNVAGLAYLLWPVPVVEPVVPRPVAPPRISMIQPIEPPATPAPTQVIPAEPARPAAPVKPPAAAAMPPVATATPLVAARPSAVAPPSAVAAPPVSVKPSPTVPPPAPAPSVVAKPPATGVPRAATPPVVSTPPASPAIPDKPFAVAPDRSVRTAPDARPAPVQPAPAVAAPPRADTQRYKLEVLSYSDTPAQRLVFINGRAYREGATLEGGARIEEIREDGVILSDQGQRFTLR